MLPLICTFLVTADIHTMRGTYDLLSAISDDPWAGTSWSVVVGDLVDTPSHWGVWDGAQRRSGLDIIGVAGNHDGHEFAEHFEPYYRSSCRPSEDAEPEFVAFTMDPYLDSGDRRADDSLEWATENYPNTPWVIFSHRPPIPCSSRYVDRDEPWRRRLERVIPPGSIVVTGHEHIFCVLRGMGWTQITSSTGGSKKYECRDDLDDISFCEKLPDHPTYLRIDPRHDTFEQVVVTPDGNTARSWSIMAGPLE